MPLLTVSGILKQYRPDWKQKLVDLNVEKLKDKHLKWADMAFVSAMIIQKESVKEIIRRCREKGVKVVAGGPLFTSEEKETEGIDHFILNEAEITLPLFLKDLEKGTPKHRYETLGYPNLKDSPPPNWDLLKGKVKHYASMAVQFSRGCPHKCEFCDVRIMFGRNPRVKSAKQFLYELSLLHKLGFKGSVFVVDDNLIGNKIEAKKMLRELIVWQEKQGYPFRFFTEASIKLAEDKELMTLMSKANFYKVFIGIETPSKEGLKECGKSQNVKSDLTKAIKDIQGHGMMVMSGHIVGFDSDTEETFDAQINFVQENGLVIAMVGLLSVLPKTDLERRLREEGRLLGKTTGENTDMLTFVPKMDKDVLIKGYHHILRTIYSSREYYKRVDSFIRSYKPTVKVPFGISDLKGLRALAISTLRIGFSIKDGPYFWSLLIKTLFKKPKAFAVAVELAICRLHFQSVANRIINQ